MATARSDSYAAASGGGVFAGIPAAIPTSFATGGVTGGSYNAGTFLWTPERNAAGTVKALSYAEVPTGVWVAVANTAVDALAAEIDALIPGWSAFTPNARWDDWVSSWSGICPDWGGARFWRFGGGHTNGSANFMAGFNAFSMAWAIAALPSDPAAWSTAYKTTWAPSSSTGYPESNTIYAAKLTAGTAQPINDVCGEETEESTPKPTARHTYEGMIFDSARNCIWMTVRRQWKLNLSTGQWTRRRRIFDSLETNPDHDYLDGENIFSVFDETTNILTTTSNGSTYGGGGRVARFNVATDAWVSGTDAGIGPYTSGTTGDSAAWQNQAQCSTRVGRTVYFVRAPFGNDPETTNGSDGWYGTLNMDTGVVTQVTGFAYGGGLSRASFRRLGGDTNSQGLVAVGSTDTLLFTTWDASAATTLYSIDRSTSPWTISPGPADGSPPPYGAKLARSMMWSDSLNAIVCHADGTGNVRIRKYA